MRRCDVEKKFRMRRGDVEKKFRMRRGDVEKKFMMCVVGVDGEVQDAPR